jgi:hypothetical protein
MEVLVQGLAAVGNLIPVTTTVLPGVFAVVDRVGWILLVFLGGWVIDGRKVPIAAARVMVCACMVLVTEGRGVPSCQTRVGVMVLNKTVLTCGVFSRGWVSEQASIKRMKTGRMISTRQGEFLACIDEPVVSLFILKYIITISKKTVCGKKCPFQNYRNLHMV